MSQAHPDWWQSVNAILAEHEERIKMLEATLLDDGADASTLSYDLRTYDQRADAQLADHQVRIAALEQRIRHLEQSLHRLLNHAEQSADDLS